jgi:hypothetical protein
VQGFAVPGPPADKEFCDRGMSVVLQSEHLRCGVRKSALDPRKHTVPLVHSQENKVLTSKANFSPKKFFTAVNQFATDFSQ